MSRTEATIELEDPAIQDRVSAAAKVLREPPAISWDPYEVWLSRVKRPRDLAARLRGCAGKA
jgi:hypothetical protein